MPTRLVRPSLPAGLLALLAGTGPTPAADPAFTPAQVAFYEKEVLPVLQQHCLKCHGAEPKVKGGLNLATRAGPLAGGDTGPAFDPKDPGKSLLLKAVEYAHEEMRMPPKGKLPDKELAVLRKWVADGLPYPPDKLSSGEIAKAPHKGGVVTAEAKRYWAYQRVARPTVPAVKNAGLVRTPIDAFVLAKLEAKGLAPVKSADRATLVRRAYYDLWGLPPTPEQVEAFVNDPSPDAWAKLIDALLASPHYGEKWGRHWLDVVRFAETNGYERDGPKPNAWKYRDYVIRSLNADKPYDRFIKEQLAGDELPWDRDAIIATGFYRLGIWDDEPADRAQALFDGFDDLVTVTGQGFLGMSLNCARCHDHKVDPFPQTDYYRLLAFFRDVRPFSDTRGVSSSNNSTDVTPPEKRQVYEAELMERQAQVAALDAQMKPIEDAAIKKMPPEDQLKVDDGKRDEVVRKVPKYLDPPQRAAYQRLVDRRRELIRRPTPSQEFALSVNNCEARPPATHLLVRGSPHSPGKEVRPGFPEVLGFPDPAIPDPPPGAKTSGRRTILANWVTSRDNPLTARVMVNRVWQHHFGKGIVPSANDFGKLGEPASHPELLDWLAAEFVDGGWTLKRLHKLIMTSGVYQLSSAADPAALKADPANALLWRFNMRRLTAEEVRDSVLMVSGKLDPTPYGPSVYPKIPDAVLAGQSVPGNGWLKTRGGGYDPKDPDAGNRRSVYVYVKRSLQVPVLIAHDQADTDSSCPVRYTTTVPTQALGLLNGEFANDMAAAFATRLAKEALGDLAAQVARGLRLTTGRAPTPAEVAKDVAFVTRLKTKYGLDDATALKRYALLLLNTNEFVYLD